MKFRKALVAMVTAALDFIAALISAVAWANIFFGYSEIKIALIFFGGLFIPYLGNKFKKNEYFGLLTRLSALAGFLAVSIDFFVISGPKALGALLWLEGDSSIALNLSYTVIFFGLEIFGLFCITVFLRRSLSDK